MSVREVACHESERRLHVKSQEIRTLHSLIDLLRLVISFHDLEVTNCFRTVCYCTPNYIENVWPNYEIRPSPLHVVIRFNYMYIVQCILHNLNFNLCVLNFLHCRKMQSYINTTCSSHLSVMQQIK